MFLEGLSLWSPQQRRVLLYEFNSMWSCFWLLTQLHLAGMVAVVRKSQEGASACSGVGALQCGELWVKEEVARLLQAKLKPGIEPLLRPHIRQS